MIALFRIHCFLIVALGVTSCLHAQSGIDLVAGFDESRIEDSFTQMQQDGGADLAKLIYKLRKVNGETLDSRVASDSQDAKLGDIIRGGGKVSRKSTFAIPESLHEFLGFDSLTMLIVASETEADERASLQVFATGVSKDISVGDRVTLLGMKLASQTPSPVAAANLSWFPATLASPSRQWLADQDFDISLLPELAARDRKRLTPQDSDAFYRLLQIVQSQPSSELPDPVFAKPIDLLQRSRENIGEFISMELESIQITRVTIENRSRVGQLGSDHYFQIDAMGDLGNVVIKIETPDSSPSGEAATFENRFPVSVVVPRLPMFLKQEMQRTGGTGAIMSDVSMRIQVDGFFFRLWSYSTDYMKQFGDAEQFGPLVIAAKIENREPATPDPDPVGVRLIGWLAAAAIAVGLLGILIWHRITTAGDRAVQRKRRAKVSDRLLE